mgnify:FL=1
MSISRVVMRSGYVAGTERIGRTAHRALSRLHQFQWEVSRYDTAPARGMRVTRFTDHLLRIAVSRQCSR